ncbi:MAG: dextransucrase, partial [Limosilactobacillus sp.]|nr:dextransucrase [Limosilactobacillus sp.]
FDGIRVDAIDNVDADLSDIAGDYFNAVYKANESDANANKHISILENWASIGDIPYIKSIGSPQITMESKLSGDASLRNALGRQVEKRANIRELITNSIVDRTADSTENVAFPNYSFSRAHDNGSQDDIRWAIAAASGKPYGVFNQADEEAGMKLFIDDQNSTIKKWNYYNMPATYAYLLTNKDTIPRVYYGDMYTDGGQFMEHKTRYYDSIVNLLKSRIKYVAGGQTMSVDNHDVLTSVRFGKGAMKVTDAGTSETRTQGIGVVISNNPNLNIGNDAVVLHMGAAHKNQTFRAALLATKDGVLNFDSDKNAPIAKTDANGDLRLYANDLVVDGVTQANTGIRGFANPDVSGYLAVWVPVGATDDQDARTAPSTEKNTDGMMYHSNAALDSNVIFEAFSNFIYTPKKHSDAMNYKLARNAAFFKDLGITSMELPPQYNSSKDGTFLDSIINNGYAFDDRYDLGMSEDNKYGSAQDLRDALKAIHAQGMQAMLDWVPDQIYNMPGKEVVQVTRVHPNGRDWENGTIKHNLYVVNTIGGGEYQKKYGGAFLAELQEKYPEIFTKIQRGVGYVLSADNGKYFMIGEAGKQFLPATLDPSSNAGIGFRKVDGDVYYYDANGAIKNQWKQDADNNWYYFGQDGKMLTDGLSKVVTDNHEGEYYFLPNGVSLRNGLVTVDGNTYYFDKDGKLVKNRQITVDGVTYEIEANGNVKSETYNPKMA